MLTDKQKYFHLMGEVCEQLAPDAVDATVRAGYKTPSNLLAMVRLGRRANLPDLVAMVEVSLPAFEIPTHLRPAA
ncbi:hypothetical protein [Hymenobacter algoricola]|uniref:XRE family transcriptional regulator n=1 Tax=Hymenobacter algoricola TaxID=486267 RepID=A0ABP7NTQ8_9BACT